MIFFPNMYEDELLYSVIARYHIRSGNISYIHTTQDVYGRKYVESSIYLPSNISNLISNLPKNYKSEEKDIILNHTLYPFYTAFLSEDMSNQIFKSMKGEHGGDIYARAGICASTISIPKYLKFCPECFKEEIEKYGEAYWHRIHQIQCVKICPKHKAILQDSIVKIKSYNKQEYITPNKDNCMIKDNYEYDEDTIEKLYELAKNVEYILNSNFKRRDRKWYRNNYINYLIKNNLATPKERIRQNELVSQFKQYYGDKFLNIVESNIEYEFTTNWLSDIARSEIRYNIHPIRQLLFIKFLNIKIDDIFCNEYKFKPFGEGPWPCFNKASEHYQEKVINEVCIKYSNHTHKITGTFSCSCGYTYLSESTNENKDIFNKLRVIKFGYIWEQKLTNLVLENELSINEISEQLDLDWLGIYRYIIKLGLTPPIKTSKKNIDKIKKITNYNITLNDKDITSNNRTKMLNLLNQYPEKSRTEIKSLNRSLYVYLQKYDREWMELNLPKKRNKKARYTNVDWKKRDTEILLLIKDFILKFNNISEKPKWINLTVIGKSLNIYDLLRKHLYKLPNTSEYLSTVIESNEQYSIRKIKWAINEIMVNGDKRLNMTRVSLKAGVKVTDIYWKNIVKEEINNYMNSKSLENDYKIL